MRITVDDALRTRFHNFDSRLEVCDESGHLLGYFTPATANAMYEGIESPTDPQELQRRSREGGGRSLEAILDDLQRQG